MNYQSITPRQQEKMLQVIGLKNTEELFVDIPENVRLDRPLNIEGGFSEMELSRHVKGLASRNQVGQKLVSFAGGGCYDHYIPASIDHILRRPEFFTAYTPYQPEVSQGTLQAIYEYQTGICNLTGMDIANASMYDGATALVEAAFMSTRITKKRREIIVTDSLNPQYIETLHTYEQSGLIDVSVIEFDEVIGAISERTAGVCLGYPNYYGEIEDLEPVIKGAGDFGAISIVCANPIMLALLKNSGALGADIVVGEGQCLGNPQSFGGPGLGFFAARKKHSRSMPGRIVGKTVDRDDSTGYVLTLATREQHIRREKATSNICSNHALNALAAGAYLALMGSKGLRGTALQCVSKANYLRKQLLSTNYFVMSGDSSLPHGYEFVLSYLGDARRLHKYLLDRGFLAGIVLDDKNILFAVTEKRTKEEMDTLVAEVMTYGL